MSGIRKGYESVRNQGVRGLKKSIDKEELVLVAEDVDSQLFCC